jgi:hypothetical protein
MSNSFFAFYELHEHVPTRTIEHILKSWKRLLMDGWKKEYWYPCAACRYTKEILEYKDVRVDRFPWWIILIHIIQNT